MRGRCHVFRSRFSLCKACSALSSSFMGPISKQLLAHQHPASQRLLTVGNNCSWPEIFFIQIFRIRTGVQIYALPILCSLKEFGNSGPLEKLWNGNGKGKEFTCLEVKVGKVPNNSVCTALFTVIQKPFLSSPPLTHKHIKISSVFAHFDWIDVSSNFSTCKKRDILTDILLVLH